jgi:hypothetical protein
MPHKGFFTAGASVLLPQPLPTETITRALAPFTVRRHSPAEGEKNWISGYESWLVAFRPEVNGLVIVDQVDAPWPDSMGDPKGDAMLFGAWSTGFFGPSTWPGNLARAKQFASAFTDKEAAGTAGRHQAFLRIRSSYVMGAEDQVKIVPADYDARKELEFVTSVALALTRVEPNACYFNPGGETLFTARRLHDEIEHCTANDLPALPAWSQVRLFRMEDEKPWCVFDTVGMEQLDAQDHECCFIPENHSPNDIARMLRNMSLYTLQNGPVIRTGHTADGPGGRWRAIEAKEALAPAPRPTVRWLPPSGPKPPARFLQGAQSAPPPPAESKATGIANRLKSWFGK